MRIASSLMIATVAGFLFARDAACQLAASELAFVAQTVDGTKVSVSYSRPRARGRSGLFGSQIKWGDTWTPGANTATVLTVSNDVTIHGQPVPKGAYSVWFVVSKDPWEMILDRDTALFHTTPPKQRSGQVRFTIPRERRPFMETLTWWFPDVHSAGLTLAMQWDTVHVALPIKVQPSYTRSAADDVARRIVGRYRVHFEPMPIPPTDSTVNEDPDLPPADYVYTVRHENGELRVTMDPPMFKTESGYTEWILLPRGNGFFRMGRFDGSELVEIIEFLSVEFDGAGAQARSFEIRAPNDALAARGTRVP